MGTAVSVAAHSGLGDVQVFGLNEGGFATGRVMQATATSVTEPPGSASSGSVPTGSVSAGQGGNIPRIVVDAQTGVGHVQVTRAGP